MNWRNDRIITYAARNDRQVGWRSWLVATEVYVMVIVPVDNPVILSTLSVAEPVPFVLVRWDRTMLVAKSM